MIKKTFLTVAAMTAVLFLSVPAQAQFKGLGKSLGKAAKDAGKSVSDAAGDMASDIAATKVSTNIATFMDNNNTVVTDEKSPYNTRINKVASNLSKSDVTLNFKVYQNDEINLLGLADGSIRVYTGMMDMMTDDELTALVAVQAGHIANKDTRNALISIVSEDNTGKATGAQMDKMLSMSGDKMGSIINELLQVPFSLDQSIAADKYAVTLMKSNTALESALAKVAALASSDAEALNASGDDAELSLALKYNTVNGNYSERNAAL